MDKKRIAILGDGGWGTALALVLARKGLQPILWGAFPEYLDKMYSDRENKNFLPGITLPSLISFEHNLEKVISDNNIIVVAIPTAYLRSTAERITKINCKGKIFVSCTKGIEQNTLLTPYHILQKYVNNAEIAVLSGPSHAEEVARAVPTCVVVAAHDENVASEIQDVYMEERFRVYTSSDVIGLEYGGALKNVIAIAAGICDGLKFGSNTKAALLSRGLQEIVRLGCACGSQKETFFGLSGMGDLVTTCFSEFGRNRHVGERIGKGEKIKDILKSMQMVAEGVNTTKSAYALAEKHEVEMPIVTEVYRILYEDKDPLQSISDLMMRTSKSESE